jgi:mRNA deadenylase 3'-5' endonuclease subunit Ccr4
LLEHASNQSHGRVQWALPSLFVRAVFMTMAFTLATWNILATAYIRPSFYPNTPRQILDPAWRIPALVLHAQGLGADILCLQEVEAEVFAALQAGLAGLGYIGTYARKGGNRPDGCATFFRSDCFTLATDTRTAYSDGGGLANSGHIAQFLRLDRQGKRLDVVNTHLKWDPPDTPPERQWAYRQICQVLDVLRPEAASSTGQIVCGDFNVLPQSDVVEALRRAGFDYAHRECRGICTCNSNGQPKLIDYLFYSGSLRATPLLPASIDAGTPLPSADQPSDHLPLIAQFDWLET